MTKWKQINYTIRSYYKEFSVGKMTEASIVNLFFKYWKEIRHNSGCEKVCCCPHHIQEYKNTNTL